jgi:hypothetical protein
MKGTNMSAISLYPNNQTRSIIIGAVSAQSAIVSWAINVNVGIQFDPSRIAEFPIFIPAPNEQPDGFIVQGAGSGSGIASATLGWNGTSSQEGMDADDWAFQQLTNGVSFGFGPTVVF